MLQLRKEGCGKEYLVGEIRGVYKYCHWGLDIAPIMIAFFLLYVPPFFCTPQSEKSFQHRHSIKPRQRRWRSVLKGA